MIQQLTQWTKFLHQDAYLDNERINKELKTAHDKIQDSQQELLDLQEELLNLKAAAENSKNTKKQLKERIDGLLLGTELEQYCEKNFTELNKFAYKDKRYSVKEKFISMYPNEMIKPDCFEIVKARKAIGVPNRTLEWYRKVGDFVAENMKWKSDQEVYGVLDFYSYPSETLVLGHSDCESHASIVSSIEPEMGIAFGRSGTTWHAWNVFVLGGELYGLETNSTPIDLSSCIIFNHNNQKKYKINWIFTRNRTFRVDGGTHFGVIAR